MRAKGGIAPSPTRAIGLPVHRFQTLLADLVTLTRNTIVLNIAGAPGWPRDTEPTLLQIRSIEFLATHPMP